MDNFMIKPGHKNTKEQTKQILPYYLYVQCKYIFWNKVQNPMQVCSSEDRALRFVQHNDYTAKIFKLIKPGLRHGRQHFSNSLNSMMYDTEIGFL
jgi:hypothetical protein